MATMVRKQVYIEPRQEALLKRLVRERGVTEAEIIRRAIDRETNAELSPDDQLDPATWEEARAFIAALIARKPTRGVRDIQAWEREKTFIAEWVAAGSAPGGRQWRREDAYAERLSRYGR